MLNVLYTLINSQNLPNGLCEMGTLKGILLTILLAILSFCLINRSAQLVTFTSSVSLEGWPCDHTWQIRCKQESTEWGF